MKTVKIYFCWTLLTLGATSCFYDKEETLYPNANCDTEDSTFTVSVKPILQSRCYTCHDNDSYSSQGGGLRLDDYTLLKQQIDNGVLLKAINHEVGAEPMPKNSEKLTSCDIQKISNWISAGAQNN